MKALAASIAAAVMLVGCGQTTPSVDTEALHVVIKKIQETAVKICSFLPTDTTVVAIIKASSTGETAYSIASAICNAVTSAIPKAHRTTWPASNNARWCKAFASRGSSWPAPAKPKPDVRLPPMHESVPQ